MASIFLQACIEGNTDQVRSLLDSDPDLIYQTDETQRNCLNLSVLHGHWHLSWVLLRHYHVSPHCSDSTKENILHHIARGLSLSSPTAQDFEESQQENLSLWTEDEAREISKLKDLALINTGRCPKKVLVKSPQALLTEMFGKPELFLPKLLVYKFHVVLERKNNEGLTPHQLAVQLGQASLAEFYSQEVDTHATRRRLLQGMNENLIRSIGSYL